MQSGIRNSFRLTVAAGLAVIGVVGMGQANIINLTHPYTNTTIAAVIATNLTQDGDVILVNTNMQTENGISLTKGVTITGLGMGNTIVQAATNRGGANANIFGAFTAGKVWAIQNMTLRYGSNASYGAAVHLQAATTGTLMNCNITQNDANNSSGYAGAIAMQGANNSLLVTNCIVSSNVCLKCGALEWYQTGSLVVRDSAFFDNYNRGGGKGGAITIDAGRGYTSISVLIANSTFTRNVSENNGGAISISQPGYITNAICNCTIYSNSAATGGGGIDYYGSNLSEDRLIINSCILVSNAAPTGTNVSNSYGVLTITNSILGSPISGGTANYTNGCILNVNPSLLPLGNNGGNTPTMALAAGSPAINKGANPNGLLYDQRGAPYQRQVGTGVDIGAYEYGAGPTNLTYSTTNGWTATGPGVGTINYLPDGNTFPQTLHLNDAGAFSGSDGTWPTNGKMSVANLPAGLTVWAVRTNGGADLVIWLSGTANPCTTAQNASNLMIGFTDAAFGDGVTAGVAAQITGAATNQMPPLSVMFIQQSAFPGALTYSSTNFYENILYNDGRIGNTNTIAVSGGSVGETFSSTITPGTDLLAAYPNPGAYAAIAGVPGGLTPHVIVDQNTSARFYLSGQASAHAAANSTSVVLTFSNAAFTSQLSPTNAVTASAVTFYDPAMLVTLNYSGTTFNESANNDGTIANTITVTLASNLFVSGVASNVSFVGLPASLTGQVTYVNSTNVTLALTGAAASNNALNNASFQVQFQPGAFYNLAPGATVVNSNNAVQISFLNPGLTYSGTNFVEYWQNDGSIGNSLTLTLAGDVFAGTNGEDYVVSGKSGPSNVPNGLTASVVQQSPNQLSFRLLGNALAHNAPANNIANLGLAFSNAAFSLGGAAAVTNGSVNNLLVTYVGATTPSNFWVSVNTGSDTTGDGSYANPWKTVGHAFVYGTPVRPDAFDTINVMAGIYNETNITVNKIVAIQGAGRDATFMQACPSYAATTNDKTRVFTMAGNTAVRDMTLRYGWVTNGTSGSCVWPQGTDTLLERCRVVSNVSYGTHNYNGGAVAPGGAGHLTLRSCDFIGNRSIGGGEASLYIGATSSLTASNCTFIGNQSASQGAGIYNYGSPLVLQDCVVMSNAVTQPGGSGGGVVSELAGGTFDIERCTIANNFAPGNAGGIYLYGTGMVVNCTISGNVATNGGGGVFIYDGMTKFYNSTIAGNTTSNGAGGGIYQFYTLFGTWSAYSTLVAGNFATNGPDVGGSVLLADNHCLIGNNTNANMTYAVPAGQPNGNGSYVGTAAAPLDPLLLPLANNGGVTPTCALQKGSPAIDHGSNPLNLPTDQRLQAKWPRQYGVAADIGAYEFVPASGSAIMFR